MAYIFTILGIFIQLALLIALLLSRDEHKEKVAITEKYLEEQKGHYEYLSERETDTKKFRHDMKNHLLMLKQLYDSNEREEFEKYFHAMGENIELFGKAISVNNPIADAIINRYASEAKRSDITFMVSGHFPAECYLSAYDICTVLANLLSNAIEAERKTKYKNVYLTIRHNKNELFLEVKNDYDGKLIRQGDGFVTTKRDKVSHGIGMMNVRECVEKNSGFMTVETENNIFKVRVCLNNEKKEDNK